jgi:single-strand DNA-binding protein
MNLNQVVIAGNITKDPELTMTTNGTAKTTFTVAVNRNWTDRDGNKQEETQFIPVQAWAAQAESCVNYLTKGQEVIVTGRLQIDKFTAKDGTKVTYPYVTSFNVQFGRKPNGNGSAAPSPDPDEEPDDIPF